LLPKWRRAIYDLLKAIDLKAGRNLREEINSTNSETKIKKYSKRLKVMDALLSSRIALSG